MNKNTHTKIPNILSIAGSDPSGGAGVQADIKTIQTCGGYGMAAITALTVQNTRGVYGIHYPPADFVADQVAKVFEDIDVHAVKIGMAGNVDIIAAVADILKYYAPKHIVLDPVMVATSGDALSEDDSVHAMITYLFPLATIITPNIPEAEVLIGRKFSGDTEQFAQDLLASNDDIQRVFLKGGHGTGEIMRDVYADKNGVRVFDAPRIETQNTHGTGCTLSSAIATYLAHGKTYQDACGLAKAYVIRGLERSNLIAVGAGTGPLYHS